MVADRVPYRIIPPPPPPMMRMLSFALAIIAALLGFGGFSLWAGIFAGLSFAANVGDFFANRGVVRFPGRGSTPKGISRSKTAAGSRFRAIPCRPRPALDAGRGLLRILRA